VALEHRQLGLHVFLGRIDGLGTGPGPLGQAPFPAGASRLSSHMVLRSHRGGFCPAVHMEPAAGVCCSPERTGAHAGAGGRRGVPEGYVEPLPRGMVPRGEQTL
jgi:hypothetical protein